MSLTGAGMLTSAKPKSLSYPLKEKVGVLKQQSLQTQSSERLVLSFFGWLKIICLFYLFFLIILLFCVFLKICHTSAAEFGECALAANVSRV